MTAAEPRPYLDYYPEPRGPLVDVLKAIIASPPDVREIDGTTLTYEVQVPQPPSAVLAIEMQLKAAGCQNIRVEQKPRTIPDVDPRELRAPVDWPLWEWNGVNAVQNLTPPTERIRDLVTRLAREPYHYESNWERAGEIAAGLTANNFGEVMSTAINPPPLEPGESALEWLPRVQLAAAQILARLEERTEPWHDSIRRAALANFVYQCVDWVNIAGIVALVQVGRHFQEAQQTIWPVLIHSINSTPSDYFCCYADPLLTNALLDPELAPEVRQQFESLRAQIIKHD